MIDHHGMCLGTPCSCETVTGPVPTIQRNADGTRAVQEPDPGKKPPALSKPFQIQVSKILVLDNVPAGMNPYVVMSLTYLYRSTTDDVEPIKVWGMGGGLYRIMDGRHRFVASLMAGRPTVLAQEVDGWGA